MNSIFARRPANRLRLVVFLAALATILWSAAQGNDKPTKVGGHKDTVEATDEGPSSAEPSDADAITADNSAADEPVPTIVQPVVDANEASSVAEQLAPEPDEPAPVEQAPIEQATVEQTTLEPGEAPAAEPTRSAPVTATPPRSASPLLPTVAKVAVETAIFNGVQPGSTTSDELEQAWGVPRQIKKGNNRRVQIYEIEPFQRVSVTMADDRVAAVAIYLEQPVGCETAAKRFGLAEISSVQVNDESGQLLGEAFPERGIMFGYAPNVKKTLVAQVVMEPVGAQSFLLRAESNLSTHYAHALADADNALKLDPQSGQAQWLRAEAFRRAGALNEAATAAEAAVASDGTVAAWRLTLAKILAQRADYARAKQHIQTVIEARETTDVERARAHSQMGDCLNLAPESEGESALKHHQQAIKIAEPLVNAGQVASRRAAKEVLIDAHLGMAYDIGWGKWQQKSTAVTKWVERALKIAQDFVDQEDPDSDVLLKVNERALAAAAGVSGPVGASTWADRSMQLGATLIEKSVDPARTARLHWQLGMALCEAMQIEQARHHYGRALDYGRHAAEHLEKGDPAGQQLPNHDYLIGRLHYRLGVLHALGKHDHAKAVAEYSRAVELLEAPVPPSAQADAGRQGETFVSMAVSFWEVGNHGEAMRLTKQGVKLMEQAVEEGLLSKKALAVPYSNLSSMLEDEGDAQLAAEFAALAATCQR